MECRTCPVSAECDSARNVAIRSCGDDVRKDVWDKIHGICPLEEIMYATFLVAVHNAQNVIDGGDLI